MSDHMKRLLEQALNSPEFMAQIRQAVLESPIVQAKDAEVARLTRALEAARAEADRRDEQLAISESAAVARQMAAEAEAQASAQESLRQGEMAVGYRSSWLAEENRRLAAERDRDEARAAIDYAMSERYASEARAEAAESEVSRLTRALDESQREVAKFQAMSEADVSERRAAEAALEEARKLIDRIDASAKTCRAENADVPDFECGRCEEDAGRVADLRAALAAVDAERREGGMSQERKALVDVVPLLTKIEDGACESLPYESCCQSCKHLGERALDLVLDGLAPFPGKDRWSEPTPDDAKEPA